MTGGYVVNDGPDAGPGHADAPRHRPGRRGGLAQPAQGAGPADVRRADELRAGRPRRAAAGRRPRPELDRHQRRGRHRRPDPRHHLDPRRHPGRRRPADRPGGPAAVRAGPDRRDRRGQPHRGRIRQAATPPATADVAPVRYTPEVVAAPFDPAVCAALAGAGTDPGRRRISTRAGHSDATRLRRWRAGRTRWARCCGAACNRTPSRAARS